MLERYISRFWLGAPFELFNTGHLISLALVALACTLLVVLRGRFTQRGKSIFRLVLASMLLLSQAAFVLWLAYIDEASLATALPLHLCSLFSLVSAFMLLLRSYQLYEYSYFLGGGGAILALLTPDVGMYNFPHFLPMQTLVAHGSLLVAQVYMTSVEGFRPQPRSLKKVVIAVLIYTGALIGMNTLTGANYMFLAYKPDFPTPLDLLGPWPWYIPAAVAGGLLLCVLLYLPFRESRPTSV